MKNMLKCVLTCFRERVNEHSEEKLLGIGVKYLSAITPIKSAIKPIINK